MIYSERTCLKFDCRVSPKFGKQNRKFFMDIILYKTLITGWKYEINVAI